MHNSRDKCTSNSSWVRVALDDRNSGIRGNAEGLKYLRDKIDEALVGEGVLMKDFDCDFEQIEVTDDYPEKEQGFVGRLFGWVCGIIAILIFVIGLIALVGLVVYGYILLNMH
jgi:hypothetical protein